MDYTQRGFNNLLERASTKQKTIPLTEGEIDRIFPEIPGEKISNYKSNRFSFLPTNPSANPKEGEVYYDTEDKKLKIFNGASYEEITSS